jgi:hypothetical protein
MPGFRLMDGLFLSTYFQRWEATGSGARTVGTVDFPFDDGCAEIEWGKAAEAAGGWALAEL